MKVNLVFAEVHTPLFLAGTNWGMKLSLGHCAKGNIDELAYDREHGELLVKSKGMVAIVPSSNVVAMHPLIEGQAPKPVQQPAKLKAGPKPKAQVGGPTHHVFAEGPGKARD